MTDEAVTDLTRGVYRRLYSGFTKGQRINKLSLPAEAWFWRVLSTVDDFGNGEADPELCRQSTAGRRKVTVVQISKWLEEMAKVGLIEFYEVKGERYLHVVGFESWQPGSRNGKRYKRFPAPEDVRDTFVNTSGESRFIQIDPELSKAQYKQIQIQNDQQNKKQIQNHAQAAIKSPPFSTPEFLEALSDFEQHRKEIKKRVTPKARSDLYRRLLEWGEQRAIAAIRYSIGQGWTGVFEEKQNGQNQFRVVESASQRNARNLRENLNYLNSVSGGSDPPDYEDPIGLLVAGTGNN